MSRVFLACFMFCLCMMPASAQRDIARHKAAVVKVTAQTEGVRKTGTGFIVEQRPESLYIVTASHVVEGDPAPQVEFFTARNRRVPAEIVKLEGGNPKGLALLAIRGNNRIPEGVSVLAVDENAQLADAEEVLTIGFGQGQGDWAVLKAYVVSHDGRDLKLDGRIEEGNSGGPVLKAGKVVGLITSSGQGLGLATPALFVAFVLRNWGVDLASARTAAAAPVTPVEAELEELEAALKREATVAPPKPADQLAWQDGSLRYVGTLVMDKLSGTAMLKAEVSDLRTGAKLGTYEVPALPSFMVSPTEVVLTAVFNVPADSTTPVPHSHTSNLFFQEQPDGSATLLKNCVSLAECYPASGRVVEPQ